MGESAGRARARGQEEGRVLLVHVPVEHVNATVEAKQVVELGHEIEGDGPGRQLVSGMGPKEGGGGGGGTTGTYDWGRLLGFQPWSGWSGRSGRDGDIFDCECASVST